MNTKQLAASLELIAPLAEPKAGDMIVHLSKTLASIDAKSIGPLAGKIEKGLKAKGRMPAPNAASLIVRRMSDVAGAAGSGPLSKEFAATARVLEALGSVEPHQIAAVVADALAPPPKKEPQKSKASKAPPVDPREMADKLTEAISDNAKFDSLVATLGKLSQQPLEAVAQHFLGTLRKFKTKKDAISAIQARQRQDALDATRERSISKIAV